MQAYQFYYNLTPANNSGANNLNNNSNFLQLEVADNSYNRISVQNQNYTAIEENIYTRLVEVETQLSSITDREESKCPCELNTAAEKMLELFEEAKSFEKGSEEETAASAQLREIIRLSSAVYKKAFVEDEEPTKLTLSDTKALSKTLTELSNFIQDYSEANWIELKYELAGKAAMINTMVNQYEPGMLASFFNMLSSYLNSLYQIIFCYSEEAVEVTDSN